MRFLTLLILALIAIAMVIVGFANRDLVTLSLLPDDLGHFAGFNYSVSVPLYVAIFAGLIVGLLLGFVWEWLRESKHRGAVMRERRQRAQVESENKKLKAEKNADKDEVLVLLDEHVPAR